MQTKKSRVDYSKYQRFFPGLDKETIKRTFDATTRYGTIRPTTGTGVRRRLKAPNPALNVSRRNEPVATDTVCGKKPAINDGSTAAQYFHGRVSQLRSAHPIGESDKRFAQVLQDKIRKNEALDTLISDGAKAQVSAKALDFLRTFAIKNWQGKLYNKNQNFSEREYRDAKEHVRNLLNTRGHLTGHGYLHCNICALS